MVNKLCYTFRSQHWGPLKFFGGLQFGHACYRGSQEFCDNSAKSNKRDDWGRKFQKLLKIVCRHLGMTLNLNVTGVILNTKETF